MSDLNPVQQAIIDAVSQPVPKLPAKRGRKPKPRSEHKRTLTVTVDPDLYERLQLFQSRYNVGDKEVESTHKHMSPMVNRILRDWVFADGRDEEDARQRRQQEFIGRALKISSDARSVLNRHAVFAISADYFFILQKIGNLPKHLDNPPDVPDPNEEIEGLRRRVMDVAEPMLRKEIGLMQRKQASAALMAEIERIFSILEIVQVEYDKMSAELAQLKGEA